LFDRGIYFFTDFIALPDLKSAKRVEKYPVDSKADNRYAIMRLRKSRRRNSKWGILA
jgi:hypothetical protein